MSTLSLIHISEPTRLLSISYAVFCLRKRIGFKAELLDNRLEGDPIATMTTEHTFDIQLPGFQTVGDAQDFRRSNQHKFSSRVNESPDEPATGDSTDLG